MAQSIEDLIDAEIQQLNEFKRMAKNPRMVALMRELVTRSNGVNAAPAGPPQPPTPGVYTPPRIAPHKIGGAATGRKTAPNGLSKAVAEAVKTIKPHFSNSELAEYVLGQGFHFVSKSPRVAVMAPMEKLLKAKVIRMSRRGNGTQPHLYEYIRDKQEEN
jgi:hypothetical protein